MASLSRSLNRERKKNKETRKKHKQKVVDRTKDYKNKTLNIKKRREEKEERILYEDVIWTAGEGD